MLTRMTHPKHGVTHAYGAEIEWNKKNGWVVEAKKKEAPAVVIPEKRKPGRPPKTK